MRVPKRWSDRKPINPAIWLVLTGVLLGFGVKIVFFPPSGFDIFERGLFGAMTIGFLPVGIARAVYDYKRSRAGTSRG